MKKVKKVKICKNTLVIIFTSLYNKGIKDSDTWYLQRKRL